MMIRINRTTFPSSLEYGAAKSLTNCRYTGYDWLLNVSQPLQLSRDPVWEQVEVELKRFRFAAKTADSILNHEFQTIFWVRIFGNWVAWLTFTSLSSAWISFNVSRNLFRIWIAKCSVLWPGWTILQARRRVFIAWVVSSINTSAPLSSKSSKHCRSVLLIDSWIGVLIESSPNNKLWFHRKT